MTNYNLISLVARHQVACGMSIDADEVARSRAVVAGVLAASQLLLTPPEFERLVANCDIDPATLSDLLALANLDGESSEDTTIDLQP